MKNLYCFFSISFLILIFPFSSMAQIKQKHHASGFLSFKSSHYFVSIDSLKALNQDTVTFKFAYTNMGKSSLTITDVVTSCSCTVSDFSRSLVKSQGKGTINVKTTLSSLILKRKLYATVKSNADNDYLVLRITPL